MNRRMHGYAALRIAVAALGAALLALGGCASTDPKPQGPEETPDLVWPLPPEQPRVRYIGSYRFQKDVEDGLNKGRVLDSLLGREEGTGEGLRKPLGVYADKDGRIFVADTGWGKVVVFDVPNKSFAFWGTRGKGSLSKPIAITSDSAGHVYVTDVLQRRVVVFDKDGNYFSAMGKSGELEAPTGIALDEARKRIYVVDTKRHDIAVFDFDGNLVSTIGERGNGLGQFNFPTHLAVDGQGKIYVSDSMNFRVQILDPDGTPLKSFGKNGQNLGDLSRAKGIAVDSEGHVYVVDAAFNNFQIFDQEGKLLLYVGSLGREPGQFWLPAGAYIDGRDRIYVADQYNFRVQVFQYLGDKGEAPTTAAPTPAETPESPAAPAQ